MTTQPTPSPLKASLGLVFFFALAALGCTTETLKQTEPAATTSVTSPATTTTEPVSVSPTLSNPTAPDDPDIYEPFVPTASDWIAPVDLEPSAPVNPEPDGWSLRQSLVGPVLIPNGWQGHYIDGLGDKGASLWINPADPAEMVAHEAGWVHAEWVDPSASQIDPTGFIKDFAETLLAGTPNAAGATVVFTNPGPCSLEFEINTTTPYPLHFNGIWIAPWFDSGHLHYSIAVLATKQSPTGEELSAFREQIKRSQGWDGTPNYDGKLPNENWCATPNEIALDEKTTFSEPARPLLARSLSDIAELPTPARNWMLAACQPTYYRPNAFAAYGSTETSCFYQIEQAHTVLALHEDRDLADDPTLDALVETVSLKSLMWPFALMVRENIDYQAENLDDRVFVETSTTPTVEHYGHGIYSVVIPSYIDLDGKIRDIHTININTETNQPFALGDLFNAETDWADTLANAVNHLATATQCVNKTDNTYDPYRNFKGFTVTEFGLNIYWGEEERGCGLERSTVNWEDLAGVLRPDALVTELVAASTQKENDLANQDTSNLLLFTHWDRTNQIFTMNPDGTGQQQITDAFGIERNFYQLDTPDWSPNHQQIAYQNGSGDVAHIFVMSADGTNAQQLTFGYSKNALPQWSPDGQKIAFLQHDPTKDPNIGQTTALMVINVDGTDLQQLTNYAEAELFTWAPDSQTLAYVHPSGPTTDINRINIDGTGHRELTADRFSDTAPHWSPDGQTIIWTSHRNGRYEVFSLAPSGENVTQLTDLNGDVPQDNERYVMTPTWSPNGQHIMFSTVNYHQNDPDDRLLYVMDANGDNLTLLTDQLTWYSDTTWSPDSTQIVIGESTTADRTILIVKIADGTVTNTGINGDWVSWAG